MEFYLVSILSILPHDLAMGECDSCVEDGMPPLLCVPGDHNHDLFDL